MRCRNVYWVVFFLGGWTSSVQAQVNLAWKFQEGETLYVETIQMMKQSLESKGKTLKKELTTTTTVTSLTVKRNTPQGPELDIKIVGLKVDSDANQAADSKLAEKMKGSTFTVSLNPAGKITKFTGYEDFVKKLAGDDEAIEKQVRTGLAEDKLKKSIEATFAYLPGKAVVKGDSWKQESTESLGPFGAFKVAKVFTYQGKEEAGDLVTVAATRTFLPSRGEGVLVKVIKGSLKGEEAKEGFLFDSDKGRLIRGENHVLIRGTLTVEFMEEQQMMDVLVAQTNSIRVLANNPLAK